MPFNIPTLQELRQRDKDDMLLRLKPEANSFRGTILDVLAAVHAGSAHGLYGALDYYAKQLFPNTATGDYLDSNLEWRGIKRIPARPTSGLVLFTGKDGLIIPSGLTLQSDAAIHYFTTESATLKYNATSGKNEALVMVEAIVFGEASNLPADTKLVIDQLPQDVEPFAIVHEKGINGGSEAETDDAYRTRALIKILSPKIYGKSGDWVIWAREASAEVTDAWEFPNYKNRGALLIVVANETKPISETGFMTVVTYLQKVAPVGVLWDVMQANPKDDDYEIAITPSTIDDRILARNIVNDWYTGHAKPGLTINPDDIVTAIIKGGNFSAVKIKPLTSSDHDYSQYPVLGAIKWV